MSKPTWPDDNRRLEIAIDALIEAAQRFKGDYHDGIEDVGRIERRNLEELIWELVRKARKGEQEWMRSKEPP